MSQRTFAKTLDSAHDQYGRVKADPSLTGSLEEVGDRWEPNDEKGPSDPRTRVSGHRLRHGGGVDVDDTEQELYERARKLDRSSRPSVIKMARQAIARSQDRSAADDQRRRASLPTRPGTFTV